MDLTTYADLAVRLVNAGSGGRERGDGLATVEACRSLVADRPQLAGRVTQTDLEALRLLREELRLVFGAVSRHKHGDAVERLNALLTRHPIHTQLTNHDGKGWHLHLVESGSAADKYAAAAIAGITGVIAAFGIHRLGICAASGCEHAFIDMNRARDKRYCSDRCIPRASVRALRARGRGAGSASTAAS